MPYEVEHLGPLTLYCGDCLEILPSLTGVHALITDPPYGTGFDYTKQRRNRKTALDSQRGLQTYDRAWTTNVVGDDQPFDPAPWLQFPQVILWGAQHYAPRLPVSAAWLIWDKRDGRAEDDFASGELAWTNLRDANRIFHHLWRGIVRAGEDNVRNGPKLHPAQKPIELMTWCVQQTTGLVLDPYAGSFTTGLACLRLGRPYIGIEIDAGYFAVGLKRLTEAYRQLQLIGGVSQGVITPQCPREESTVPRPDFRNTTPGMGTVCPTGEEDFRNSVPVMGRPRLHPTNAARQAAWRQRRKDAASAPRRQ